MDSPAKGDISSTIHIQIVQIVHETATSQEKAILPSQIIGKQPDSDAWVFNADVQMDGSENLIPLEQRKFISEGKRNDHVVKIPSGGPNH